MGDVPALADWATDGWDAAPDYDSLLAELADVGVVSGADGLCRYVSPSCGWVFGWDPALVVGHHYETLVHPGDLALLAAARQKLTDIGEVAAAYRIVCGDGSLCWVEAGARLVEWRGTPLVITTLHDISERKMTEDVLERLSQTDSLTGVANRVVLMDRLHQGLARQRRGRGILAVLYVDLDRFKLINDSLGHQLGDAILRKVAERLKALLRPSDTLARLGGDEFVIVAEDMADERAAIALAERIAEAGREPFRLGDEDLVCTLSIGIACTDDSQHSPQNLLQEADMAMYRAKGGGRDRAAAFDQTLRAEAVGRLSTERMLRTAIAEGRLVVEYQPIIELRSGYPVGAEALVRIRSADNTLLLPAAFLDVAEETGMLVTIDEWVLAAAIQQGLAWHGRFRDTDFGQVAVNITGRHLADSGFADGVLASLDAAGLPHRCLNLEITERSLIEASDSTLAGLTALREEGIQIGLDDFGTGYSSLGYLREFPLDFLKIDKSFIHTVAGNNNEEAIVEAIIGLSHALGLVVVAEGVETQTELDYLRSVGCDRVQGYLLARPGAPTAIDDLVLASC